MEKDTAISPSKLDAKSGGLHLLQRSTALRIILVLGIFVLGSLAGWFIHSRDSGVLPDAADAKRTVAAGSLAEQNLRAEINLERAQSTLALQQAASAEASNSDWRQLITPGASLLAAALSAIVAYLAIVVPLNRQRKRTAEEDVIQREKDRTQRFDTSFNAAVIALGDKEIVVQAGGAAALQSLLQHSPDEFKDQVYRVVRANLDSEIGHAGAVKRLLVVGLGSALQKLSPKSEMKQEHRAHSDGRGFGWDLKRMEMAGADLRHVDLSSADIAFSNLEYANLDGAWLRRCWGYQVKLEGASLRDTDLEEARLRKATAPKASFDRARLVSARLEWTELSGACGFRQFPATHSD
ncbi:MAG: pentapeptide repeat-containing protein [Acidimicrobiales bacterium]